MKESEPGHSDSASFAGTISRNEASVVNKIPSWCCEAAGDHFELPDSSEKNKKKTWGKKAL